MGLPDDVCDVAKEVKISHSKLMGACGNAWPGLRFRWNGDDFLVGLGLGLKTNQLNAALAPCLCSGTVFV